MHGGLLQGWLQPPGIHIPLGTFTQPAGTSWLSASHPHSLLLLTSAIRACFIPSPCSFPSFPLSPHVPYSPHPFHSLHLAIPLVPLISNLSLLHSIMPSSFSSLHFLTPSSPYIPSFPHSISSFPHPLTPPFPHDLIPPTPSFLHPLSASFPHPSHSFISSLLSSIPSRFTPS